MIRKADRPTKDALSSFNELEKNHALLSPPATWERDQNLEKNRY